MPSLRAAIVAWSTRQPDKLTTFLDVSYLLNLPPISNGLRDNAVVNCFYYRHEIELLKIVLADLEGFDAPVDVEQRSRPTGSA